MISVKVDLKGILPLTGGRLQKALVRALRKAGQTALRDMRAEASKIVRAERPLKRKVIRDALRMVKSKGANLDDLSWSLLVSGKTAHLSDYPHRQTRKGVSVQVETGKRILFKSAFIATMHSGHQGVFLRRGAKRLPIYERAAPRSLDVLKHEDKARAVLIRGQRTLMAGVERLLPLELAKEK